MLRTFDYLCKRCKHKEERLITDKEKYKQLCSCGGEMEPLIGAPSLSFKGSGFYITDYRKKENANTDRKNNTSSKEEGRS